MEGNRYGVDSIVDIEQLVEGDSIFEARGYSIIKTTRRNGEKKTETLGIRVPIKSSGVDEYRDKLNQKAPVPPIKTVDGSEINKRKGELYRIYDVTDPKWLEENERFQQDVTFRVCAFALDVPVKRKDGSEASELEEKEKILRGLNLTAFQLAALAQDIRDLTQFSIERADFLSERRSD